MLPLLKVMLMYGQVMVNMTVDESKPSFSNENRSFFLETIFFFKITTEECDV